VRNERKFITTSGLPNVAITSAFDLQVEGMVKIIPVVRPRPLQRRSAARRATQASRHS
jgi:hypothetical protein